MLWEPAAAGVRLLRVYGDTPCPVLPGQVAGQPVTEVGPYCFSARREPGPGRFWPPLTGEDSGEPHPICGDFVQRVTLPDSVTALHNGAFYNCRALERLDAGPRLDALGSDLFTNCRRLKTFVLHTSPDAPTGLKKMLAAVSGDIAAEFCRGDRLLGRIFCPEYQEVLDENTPAHIFNRNIEGIGYRYRQCFTDGAVNWAEYDEAFAQADAEEPPAGLCRVALSRLAAPFALSAAAKARYEAYLHSHGALALELAIARRSRVLTGLLVPLVSPQDRSRGALACGQAGWSEGAALLLAPAARPARTKKTYDFDDPDDPAD